jgi:hypothetical protein
MKEKMMRSIVLCAALALAATRAVAQAPDADLPLARATAATILKGIRQGSEVHLFLIVPPPARFDTLTAVELLAQAPGRLDPESDYALYIGTRGARLEGDTAVVTVVMHKKERWRGMNWWRSTYEYRFVPDGAEWRFVRSVRRSHADGGDVRGALDPPSRSRPGALDRHPGAPLA